MEHHVDVVEGELAANGGFPTFLGEDVEVEGQAIPGEQGVSGLSGVVEIGDQLGGFLRAAAQEMPRGRWSFQSSNVPGTGLAISMSKARNRCLLDIIDV